MPPREALEEIVGDARVVLIGESSHGTREFYEARAEITKWLIEEKKGFCAVAAEADWPDAYRVNRYVRGRGDDASADDALKGFERFPAWMWRNTTVRDFAGWLRTHNAQCRADGRREAGGFYGLDLYSLHRSMQEVIDYLENVDPDAAQRARERYACFDHAGADDGQAYGFAAAFGAGMSCERQVVDQLVELQRTGLQYARRDGLLAEDELFYAQQNAQTVRNAEVYYRSMFGSRVSSWNLRDQHMFQTLKALRAHLHHHDGEPARIVVWAHNSHVGDARATEVGADGQLTLGQLVREGYGEQAVLIGFTTYSGTVTAASEWGGGVAERKVVRPALNGSIEELLHEVDRPEFLVSALLSREAAEPLDTVRLGRAIGVIYQPRPNGRVTTTTSGRVSSSTPSFTSIARPPCNRWNATVSGLKARPPETIRPACERAIDRHPDDESGTGRDRRGGACHAHRQDPLPHRDLRCRRWWGGQRRPLRACTRCRRLCRAHLGWSDRGGPPRGAPRRRTGAEHRRRGARRHQAELHRQRKLDGPAVPVRAARPCAHGRGTVPLPRDTRNCRGGSRLRGRERQLAARRPRQTSISGWPICAGGTAPA